MGGDQRSPPGVAAFEALGTLADPGADTGRRGVDPRPGRGGLPRRPGPAAPARLLPSGDAYFLLYAADRALLVPDEDRRGALWTSRVWPGALLVGGRDRRDMAAAGPVVTVQPWRRLSPGERDAVTAEAESLPLPGLEGKRIVVRWDE